MTRFMLSLLFVGALLQAGTDAGVRAYMKLCKKCHGPAYNGTTMKTADEWRTLFADEDKELLSVHRGSEQAIKKLTSSYYKNRRKYLMPFLIDYASDSGTLPFDPSSCSRW